MTDADYIVDHGKVVVSLGGPQCNVGCRHCYIYARNFRRFPQRLPTELVQDLKLGFSDSMSAVYLSGDIDPFLYPDRAIEFLELAAEELTCDLLFTTRLALDQKTLGRLKAIGEALTTKKRLFVGCVSIPALHSYDKIERPRRVPTPGDRLDLLGALRDAGLSTMLAMRPIFPSNMVPAWEYEELVDRGAMVADVILGEALFLDQEGVIENRLRHKISGGIEAIGKMDFFDQLEDWRIIRFPTQEEAIRRRCQENNVAFYLRSPPALELIRRYWDFAHQKMTAMDMYPLPISDLVDEV